MPELRLLEDLMCVERAQRFEVDRWLSTCYYDLVPCSASTSERSTRQELLSQSVGSSLLYSQLGRVAAPSRECPYPLF